jgi:hypothetical protein
VQLTLESGKTIENPSDEEIARSLPSEEFAVLSTSPGSHTYLQFADSKDPPYNLILEYQVESLDNQYGPVNTPLTIEGITRAFQKYARGDESWRSDFQWERMELR